MSTAVVPTNDQNLDLGPQFLQELVPAAEKTALLFEISYLCLGKFPALEKVIRANAVEVQMAFNTSDALLMQCISTSDNMVDILIPVLIKSVQAGHPTMAVRYLEKARKWIQDIIREVEGMVQEYGKLTRGVASAASEVNETKVHNEECKEKLSKESELLQKKVDHYGSVVKKKESEFAVHEKAIEAANEELQKVIKDIGSRDKKFGIVAAVIPIIGLIIDAAQKSINSGADNHRLEMAKDKLCDLRARRSELSRDLGQAQTELMHWQFQLTKEAIELGIVPDPVHLPEVQQNLTRIQQVLLQLKSFWEKIEKLVKDLEQKTFSGEDMVDFLDTFKEEFLNSLQLAIEAWTKFKCGCIQVSELFRLQNQDAYKFLETNPSTLAPVEWQQQYDVLKGRLENFYPRPLAIDCE